MASNGYRTILIIIIVVSTISPPIMVFIIIYCITKDIKTSLLHAVICCCFPFTIPYYFCCKDRCNLTTVQLQIPSMEPSSNKEEDNFTITKTFEQSYSDSIVNDDDDDPPPPYT